MPTLVSRGEILRRSCHGEIYELLAAGIDDAVDRARRCAHNVAGAQSVRLAVIHQKLGVTLLNEPYLLARRVYMSCRGSARLHCDAGDRDAGFGCIVGPHDLHGSRAGIEQGRGVCGRETLNGQRSPSSSQTALLVRTPHGSFCGGATAYFRAASITSSKVRKPVPGALTSTAMLPGACWFFHILVWATGICAHGKTSDMHGSMRRSMTNLFAAEACLRLAKWEPWIRFCRIQTKRASKVRLKPVVPAQNTTMPPRLTTKHETGNVCS